MKILGSLLAHLLIFGRMMLMQTFISQCHTSKEYGIFLCIACGVSSMWKVCQSFFMSALLFTRLVKDFFYPGKKPCINFDSAYRYNTKCKEKNKKNFREVNRLWKIG